VPALQAICDSLGEEHIRALLAKWLRILPYPFGRVNPNWDLGSGPIFVKLSALVGSGSAGLAGYRPVCPVT
jgi:hypothetical protein